MSEILEPGRIILAQRTLREPGAKPGKFYDASTLELLEGPLRVVCLKLVPGKAFYTAKRTGAPDCFSVDSITPADHVQRKMSESCSTCECAKWSKSAGSMCKDNWQMLLCLRESKVAHWFAPGASATKLLRALQRRVAVADYQADLQGNGRRHLWDFSFDITALKEKYRSHTYWTIGIDNWRFITSAVERNEWEHLAKLYQGALPVMGTDNSGDQDSVLNTVSIPVVGNETIVTI